MMPWMLTLLSVPNMALAGAGIINGDAAEENHYPEAGGLLAGTVLEIQGSSFDLKMLMCSATLIAPDVVMTAAHCVDLSYYEEMSGMQFDDVELVFSRHADLSEYSGMPGVKWPTDAAFAWDVAEHPGFSMAEIGIGLSENDDIALLFLEEPLLNVEPAVLPTRSESAGVTEGATVDIVGWGQQTSDQRPPAGTVSVKMEGQSTIGAVADYEFQVGPDSSDVRKCHGDSGGPTFMAVNGGGYRVIGVTSHAYDMTDCRETGGVDTRVDHYLDWIDSEMRSRCEDGTRSWCGTDGIIPPGFWDRVNASDDEGVKVTGCGCSQGSSGSVGLWACALLALALRRRSARGTD